MEPNDGFLSDYPALANVVDQLDAYLRERHPTVFGPAARHPVLPLKRSKVIHDNLWGTVRFSWRELALIDSPLMQRLHDIHQTGLAFLVYPSARHSRFEHCLGAATVASRVFDALLQKHRDEIRDVATAILPSTDPNIALLRLRQELRLAALLHDTGHSLFSHTSERVYEDLSPLSRASKELTAFVGKQKGAGEVISFCLALTKALSELLERAGQRLIGDTASDDYTGPIDLKNIALIIVGRSSHPFLQFMGDIVSSGFDADKLDYLLRDARSAGLPLRYDVDRYLYDVRIEKENLADGDGQLERLYSRFGRGWARREAANSRMAFPYYETYRLRLSRRAMNVIEQIVICKMMLFSYIYHHTKVRAAEGLLERLLRRKLLTSATHAAGKIIRDFLLRLNDKELRDRTLLELELAIGEELIKLEPRLGSTATDALAHAGVWVDAPKPPKFEDVDVMASGSKDAGVIVAQLFPIREWTEAYEHYRYQVRIFAFSEYWDVTRDAARLAMARVLNISARSFYKGIQRDRD